MKTIYIILGSISLGLGILGIFLPLLPTTPFLLLTAALYFKGSPRLYQWLIAHKRLGPYILNYRENKAITVTTKIISVSMLWATILICIFFVTDALWLRLVLCAVLIGVTIHLLTFKTLKKEDLGVKLSKVVSGEEIGTVARLAGEIWREHYSKLIGAEQIEYMLRKYQSAEAIAQAIENDSYEYYLIKAGGRTVGYTGVRPGEGRLFLSKIYILASERGKGYGSAALRFHEGICRERGLSSIWLTVNRGNDSSIAAYTKSGFAVARTEVADIGGGFVMDDYIMEKTV